MLIASGLAWLPLVIALACPLMMIVMMRGMHGGHGHEEPKPRKQMTMDELKEARDDLHAEIGDRASAKYPPRV